MWWSSCYRYIKLLENLERKEIKLEDLTSDHLKAIKSTRTDRTDIQALIRKEGKILVQMDDIASKIKTFYDGLDPSSKTKIPEKTVRIVKKNIRILGKMAQLLIYINKREIRDLS